MMDHTPWRLFGKLPKAGGWGVWGAGCRDESRPQHYFIALAWKCLLSKIDVWGKYKWKYIENTIIQNKHLCICVEYGRIKIIIAKTSILYIYLVCCISSISHFTRITRSEPSGTNGTSPYQDLPTSSPLASVTEAAPPDSRTHRTPPEESQKIKSLQQKRALFLHVLGYLYYICI